MEGNCPRCGLASQAWGTVFRAVDLGNLQGHLPDRFVCPQCRNEFLCSELKPYALPGPVPSRFDYQS